MADMKIVVTEVPEKCGKDCLFYGLMGCILNKQAFKCPLVHINEIVKDTKSA